MMFVLMWKCANESYFPLVVGTVVERMTQWVVFQAENEQPIWSFQLEDLLQTRSSMRAVNDPQIKIIQYTPNPQITMDPTLTLSYLWLVDIWPGATGTLWFC